MELVRKLIERHSGHNVSDGARFLPEDPNIERWAAMPDSEFDLGIPDAQRFRKLEKELTVAFGRSCNSLESAFLKTKAILQPYCWVLAKRFCKSMG